MIWEENQKALIKVSFKKGRPMISTVLMFDTEQQKLLKKGLKTDRIHFLRENVPSKGDRKETDQEDGTSIRKIKTEDAS